MHHSHIGSEHLLLGLAREDHGLAGTALKAIGVDLATLRADVEKHLKRAPPMSIKEIIPTSRVKNIIEMAFDEARRESDSHVQTDHLLIALLAEGDGVGAHILRDRGINLERVRDQIGSLRASGKTEEGSVAKPRSMRRHIGRADSKGRPVSIDLVVSAEYPVADFDDLVARITRAIE